MAASGPCLLESALGVLFGYLDPFAVFDPYCVVLSQYFGVSGPYVVAFDPYFVLLTPYFAVLVPYSDSFGPYFVAFVPDFVVIDSYFVAFDCKWVVFGSFGGKWCS